MNISEALANLQRLKEACDESNIDFNNLLSQFGIPINKKTVLTLKPYVFASKDELKQALKHAVPTLDAYLAKPYSTIEEAVKHSVSGNTFRAFHVKASTPENQPSRIYRRVVSDIFNRKIHEFANFEDSVEYEKFIINSANEILINFNLVSGKPDMMGFGRASKLLNLSCKAMIRYQGITSIQKENLIKLAHVPWDSFTIQGIRNLEPPFLIKANETMAWAAMNDVSKYKQLQQWIRILCSEVNLYPIHYEIAAWDKAH
jgi:hypothetical protein